MVSSDLAALMRAYEPDTVISTKDRETSLPGFLHPISMFVPSWSSLNFIII